MCHAGVPNTGLIVPPYADPPLLRLPAGLLPAYDVLSRAQQAALYACSAPAAASLRCACSTSSASYMPSASSLCCCLRP